VTSRRLFWSSAIVGIAIMAYGVHGALHDAGATKPRDLTRWLLLAGVTHDFVWIPLVIVAGFLTNYLPATARNPVRIGLAVSAFITITTWPLVQGWGRRAANPSALPLDYGRNLIVVLALCWITVGSAIAIRTWRRR
jgi:hypothetical protein